MSSIALSKRVHGMVTMTGLGQIRPAMGLHLGPHLLLNYLALTIGIRKLASFLSHLLADNAPDRTHLAYATLIIGARKSPFPILLNVDFILTCYNHRGDDQPIDSYRPSADAPPPIAYNPAHLFHASLGGWQAYNADGEIIRSKRGAKKARRR